MYEVQNLLRTDPAAVKAQFGLARLIFDREETIWEDTVPLNEELRRRVIQFFGIHIAGLLRAVFQQTGNQAMTGVTVYGVSIYPDDAPITNDDRMLFDHATWPHHTAASQIVSSYASEDVDTAMAVIAAIPEPALCHVADLMAQFETKIVLSVLDEMPETKRSQFFWALLPGYYCRMN